MQITVKNVKIAKFASEETLCFQASVYIDGKRAFDARNEGRGGANFYDGDFEMIRKAEDWASRQPGAYGFEDLDRFIANAIDRYEDTRYINKMLKHLCIYNGRGIEKFDRAPTDISAREWIAEKYPRAIIVNDLPIENAVDLCAKVWAR